MRTSVLKAEAELRLRNTERLRRRIFQRVAAKLGRGELTAHEAAQIRREFWEARRADKQLSRGG